MIAVPSSFAEMPRWWHDEAGRSWLARLPEAVASWCGRWGLTVDGLPMHGSNALVVPVLRGRERLTLRLTPPADDVWDEVRALRLWDGRGVVQLVDADEQAGVMLLERLDGTRSLLSEPLHDAVTILAELTRALAVPVPDDTTSTATIAAGMAGTFARDWEALGEPTPRSQLARAVAYAEGRAAAPVQDTAVDGDLHFEQVLAATRLPWVVVDPVLLRGDPEYDLGRILWSRLDELPRDVDVHAAFGTFVRVARVPPERARAWVVLRSMSYLLWGLPRGLTHDPVRCRRLLDLFC